MHARSFLALLALLGSVTALQAAPVTDKVGQSIADITLRRGDGSSWRLHDLKNTRAVVVVFLSTECPVSTSYGQLLSDLAKQYGPKGVVLVGVVPGAEPAEADELVKEQRLTFPVLADPGIVAVEAFAARVTPEVFLLDSSLTLRYRGRIDNAYSQRLKRNLEVTSHDLRTALDQLLADKAIKTPVTEAVGCGIERPSQAKPATTKLTYYRDVLPILQNRCQGCHRPGEVGPFALMTYKQALNWASDIKEYTQSRQMPPWKPVDGVAFHNERKLSDQEIATLAAWVDGGTPAGDLKDAPPARKFTDGWQLGTPDLVLTPKDEYTLDGTGNDSFRCFVLPTNLPEDAHVIAVEVRPGNPRVVHHSLLFLDTGGNGRKLEQEAQTNQAATLARGRQLKDFGPGYSVAMGVGFVPTGALSGWAPGQMARYLPEGAGYFLPKGADVVMQLHYHRNGRVEHDRTQVGLYLAKKPIQKRFQSIVIRGNFLFIPAGDANYKTDGSVWIKQDCDIYTIMPHMHMLGKEVKITLTPPDGSAPRTLVAIKDWDYNWQETYVLKQPIHVTAGTKLTIEARFDNSDANPKNPHSPPKMVFFGEQTTNEMLFGFIGCTSDTPGRIKIERRKPTEPAATAKPGE